MAHFLSLNALPGVLPREALPCGDPGSWALFCLCFWGGGFPEQSRWAGGVSALGSGAPSPPLRRRECPELLHAPWLKLAPLSLREK